MAPLRGGGGPRSLSSPESEGPPAGPPWRHYPQNSGSRARAGIAAPRGLPHCLGGTSGPLPPWRGVGPSPTRVSRRGGPLGAGLPAPFLWERGCQPGSIRLGVQFPQEGQHCRVCRVAYTIEVQQLEGPTGCPFGQEGPDGRRCSVRSRGRGVRGLGCRRPSPGARARAICWCGPFHAGE